MDNKSLSHTRWKCQYHIVFIPKRRKKQLYGQLRMDVREIIKTLCSYKEVEIVEGAICIDHVLLCVSIPPKIIISSFMGYLKGKSTLMIYDGHLELESKWSKAFWARGYYVATVGNITEDAIKKHIREQSEGSRKEDNPVKMLAPPAFQASGNKTLMGVNNKPSLEVVVANLRYNFHEHCLLCLCIVDAWSRILYPKGRSMFFSF